MKKEMKKKSVKTFPPKPLQALRPSRVGLGKSWWFRDR
jgi:hypothetical protein